MTAQTRDTLKALFETGDVLEQSSFVDLIDSFVSKVDTTAESVAGTLTVNIGSMTYTGVDSTALTTAQTSAVFTGLVQMPLRLLDITVDGSSYYMPFFSKGTF